MRPATLSTLALTFCLSLPAAAAAPQKEVAKALPLAADGRLLLETYKGSVTISTWDRAEVSIQATVVADGTCDDAADLVARTQVRIEGDGREVRVVSDYDDLPSFHFSWGDDCSSRPLVKYRIQIPRTASLRLKDYKSRIDVTGLAGDVDLETYKGGARLSGLAGRLEIDTYKGDVVAELDRLSGELRAETYKGEIELRLPRGTSFTLDREIGRHGRLESDFERASGGPRVSLETHKGTFRLRER